jgi:hypothetical protein
MEDKNSFNRGSQTSGQKIQSLKPIKSLQVSKSNATLNSTVSRPLGASQRHDGGKKSVLLLVAAFCVFVVGLAAAVYMVMSQKDPETTNQAAIQPSQTYNVQDIDLGQLATSGSLDLATSQSLSVNGQLRTNNSLVLAPISQPVGATMGQVYYDADGGVIAYYNGARFIDLAGTDQVDQVLSQIKQVESKIPTVPALPGDITLLGGNNNYSGQNLFGSGLTTNGARVNGDLATNNIVVTNATKLQGSLTVDGNTTLGSTTISNLLLNSPLAVGSGGTGSTSFTTNGVVIGQGTNALTTVSASAAGQCLMSTTGAPVFQACPGGVGSGVNSLNGIMGDVSIANASSSGSVITMDNATTATKGMASFNGSNFSVTDGAVNTIQNISVNAAPTFAGLTLTSALSVASGGTGTSSIGEGSVVIGHGSAAFTGVSTATPGQCLMSNAGTPSFQTCPGGSVAVASLNGLTGALTLNDSSTSGSNITINNASSTTKGIASFDGTNFTTAGGAVNTVQNINTTAAPTFGALTVGNITSTGTFNGQTISSNSNFTGDVSIVGALSGSGITLTNGATAASGSFSGNVAAGSVTTNQITANSAMSVGSTNQSLTLQGNGLTTLSATAGANKTTVSFVAPTANVTYRLQTATAGTYDICTTAGNCSGVGGGVTTPGGTTGRIARFSAGQTITDSILNDDGTTVTVGGVLAVNTISPTGSMTIGSAAQSLSLQGNGSTSLAVTASGVKNTLTFSTPSGANKTITLPNSSGVVAVSASGPLSIDINGNISCPSCVTAGGGSGGSSAVDSVNGLTGNVTISDTTKTGNTIIINDASSTAKGIASFNSTNFSVTGGAVNTKQNIDISAAPTFAGLTVTGGVTASGTFNGATLSGGSVSGGSLSGGLVTGGSLSATQVNGLGVSSSSITGTGSLTVTAGGTNQALTLQGSGTGGVVIKVPTFQNANGANYRFNSSDASSANAVICTSLGNCTGASGGGVVSNGSAGYVALYGTDGYHLENSILSQSGTTLTAAGTVVATALQGNGSAVTNVNASTLGGNDAGYYTDASHLSTGKLSDSRLNTTVTLQGNTFNGANQLVQLNASGQLPALSGALLTNLNAGNLTGSLDDARLSTNVALYDRNSNFTGTLKQGGKDVCTTAGNCVGTSNGAIGGGGTVGTIAMFSGTGYTVADSLLSQATGTVTVGGNLAATSIQGNGSGITGVNASQLGGQSGSYYLDAANLTGTLADGRLTSNVALLSGTQTFTGVKTFNATGTALTVSNNATIGGALTVGSVSAGASGLSVNNGTSSTTVLSGASGTVTLQNVTINDNSSVKVGSGMGVLFTDGNGIIKKLSVSGQSGNCVGYNGTDIVFQGCSGSGGGAATQFTNGANNFTGNNSGTATTRIATSYDATITNPIFGLSSNSALDIVTNNVSRMNIQAGGDISVLSNSGASTGKFTVRTQNTGDPQQYINTLVVDTTSAGSIGGRVGIGLTVGTTPQVTLDIGGGVNNYGGSGLQVRAGAAPGLSTSGSSGSGSSSTGRIYYDQTDRKFKVSENGGGWVDLVQTGGSNPILQGGNNSPSATVVLGNKYANGNGGLLIGTANNNGTISTGLHVDSNGNYLFDKPYNDNDQYGFRINGSGGNSALHVDTRYNVVSIGNLTTNSTSSYGSLVVGGNGIMSTGGFRAGTGSEDIGLTLACASSQSTVDAPQFKNGLLVKHNGCRANNSDLAEAYNSTDGLEAGELVMAAGTAATSVSRATAAKEGALMGIVSTAPSQTLGTAQVPNGYPIALSGRVPTKVTTEGGAISVGDKITISSIAGVGKKATGPGMVVGTAVEAFNGSGVGSIEVFVNLTYYEPSNIDTLQSTGSSFSQLNVSGQANIKDLAVETVTVSKDLAVMGLTTVQSIVVKGHIITSSGQPTAQAQAGSGGGSVVVSGTDTAGTITITTGGAISAGELARIVFSEQYSAAPRVVMSASNEAAAGLQYYKGSTSLDSFMINTKDAPAPGTVYQFDYFIAQ